MTARASDVVGTAADDAAPASNVIDCKKTLQGADDVETLRSFVAGLKYLEEIVQRRLNRHTGQINNLKANVAELTTEVAKLNSQTGQIKSLQANVAELTTQVAELSLDIQELREAQARGRGRRRGRGRG